MCAASLPAAPAPGSIDAMKTFAKILLGVASLLPAAGCYDSAEPFVEPTPITFTACAADIDNGEDGVLDDAVRYTYDSEGRLASSETDVGRDGTADTREVATYDARGNLVANRFESIDAAGVATVTYEQAQTFDAQDRLSKREFDQDGAGPGPRNALDYVYDAETGLLSEVRGGPNVTRYFYNDRGEMIRGETDRDSDGTIDSRDTVVLNGLGLPLIESHDEGADGTIDALYVNRYESRGYLVGTLSDHGNDGKVDYIQETSYSVDRIISKRWARPAGVPGEAFSTKYFYRYDCTAP
jgi:hypothetical protein